MCGRHGIYEYMKWCVLCLLYFSSVQAWAGETSLFMQSDVGDYIGGGQAHYYAETDGQFSASSYGPNGVSLAFSTFNNEHWWSLEFSAADGQPLMVGTYQGAVRFPFQGAGQPGLSVYGDGRGCGNLTGSFTVQQIDRDVSGIVTAFWATFQQHCDGAVAALRGEIRYNADVIVDLQVPASQSITAGQQLDFSISATDVQHRVVSLSVTNLPSGASFADLGDGTGQVSFVPDLSQVGEHLLAFHASNGAGTVMTAYTLVKVLPLPPVNDEIAGATVVTGLPFEIVQDVSAASGNADDPACQFPADKTVWFSYTPDRDMYITADARASEYLTTLSVYEGSPGALVGIACRDAWNELSQIHLDGGKTYYFMVGSYAYQGLHNLHLTIREVPAPLPPLELIASVNPVVALDGRTGSVVIKGSVSCSKQSYILVNTRIEQGHGKGQISVGGGSEWLTCDGYRDWQVTLSAPFRMKGGMATVFYDVYGLTTDGMESAQSAPEVARVSVRGGR